MDVYYIFRSVKTRILGADLLTKYVLTAEIYFVCIRKIIVCTVCN